LYSENKQTRSSALYLTNWP